LARPLDGLFGAGALKSAFSPSAGRLFFSLKERKEYRQIPKTCQAQETPAAMAGGIAQKVAHCAPIERTYGRRASIDATDMKGIAPLRHRILQTPAAAHSSTPDSLAQV